MTILRITLAATLLCLGSTVATAQDQPTAAGTPSFPMEMKPTNCEFHITTLDAANHRAGKDGLVIAIARLGNGERRQDLNRRRLHNLRTYLVEFDGRSPQTIITAEGERVGGYARVELYVGGKLFYVLMIRRNADLAVGACSFDGEDPCTNEREKKLYPCLDRKARRSINKRLGKPGLGLFGQDSSKSLPALLSPASFSPSHQGCKSGSNDNNANRSL